MSKKMIHAEVVYVMYYVAVVDVEEGTPIERIAELADEKMHKEYCYVSELDPTEEEIILHYEDGTSEHFET